MDLVYILTGIALLCGVAGVWALKKQSQTGLIQRQENLGTVAPKKSYRHIVIAVVFFLIAFGFLYLYYRYQ